MPRLLVGHRDYSNAGISLPSRASSTTSRSSINNCYNFHLMLRCLPRTKPSSTQRLFSISSPTLRQRPHRHTIMAEALPALSSEDRDTYARMGTTMEWFHNNFRNTWKLLYEACSSGKRPTNMSIRQFLNTGSEFAHHLTMHHTIGTPFLEGSRVYTATNMACRRATHLSRTCAENASF